MRPLASVFRGSYLSSVKMRSRTLPWPPVILAIMSLPHSTKMVPAITIKLSKVIITPRIILRFLLVGFLSFFMGLPFWLVVEVRGLSDIEADVWSELAAGLEVALVAFSSSLWMSKSKAWTGFRKSSVLARGVGF